MYSLCYVSHIISGLSAAVYVTHSLLETCCTFFHVCSSHAHVQLAVSSVFHVRLMHNF